MDVSRFSNSVEYVLHVGPVRPVRRGHDQIPQAPWLQTYIDVTPTCSNGEKGDTSNLSSGHRWCLCGHVRLY
jgi:hypothetical protein